MKIIALPDLHTRGIALLETIASQLAAVDLVLLPGDLTNSGTAYDAETTVKAVQRYNEHVLAVPGNWDIRGIDDYLASNGFGLHRTHKIIDGIAFLGVGGSLPKLGGLIFPENVYARFLNEAIDGLDVTIPKILVCHHPPFNTLTDITSSKQHVGSHSVRTFIEQEQPLICFTGHIHESRAIDTIGTTKIINPGPIWKGHYAYAEIDDGEVTALELREI
jgi:uncharacterized protein